MSKIICDVCGTRYPDSSEQCPICGCVNSSAANEPVQTDETEDFELPARTAVKGGRFSKANVRKRLKEQPVYEEPAEVHSVTAERYAEEEEKYDEEDFEEANGGKGGTVLNVLLVIVIIALLAVSGYIFLKYFMPNFMDGKDSVAPTESYVQTEIPTDAPTEAPTETQEPTEAPTVPCQQLVLDITDVTLREAGEMYLLNVQILPEDSTDTVMYISSNENVATVNGEGRVTAVGEGSVVISVICGEQQLECNVICDFSPEEETEAPTEAPTEPPFKDVKLGVKTDDITFRARGQQTTIKLTCDLKITDVVWTSQNENVATVTEKGVITRVSSGTTKIIGTYGEQTVEIVVRCPSK